MATDTSVGDDPVFVELQVGEKIRLAAEQAASANSKLMDEFLEDILIDYLSKSGYLADPINLDKVLAPS